MKFFLSALLIVLSYGCATQPISIYPVEDLSPPKKNTPNRTQKELERLKESKAGGFFFSLPRNLINVEIDIEKEVQSMGEYSQLIIDYHDAYSETGCASKQGNNECTEIQKTWKEINKTINIEKTAKMLKNVTHEKKYSIKMKNVTLSKSSEPDPAKQYFARIPDHFFISKALSVSLDQYGTVSKAKAKATDERFDIAMELASKIIDFRILKKRGDWFAKTQDKAKKLKQHLDPLSGLQIKYDLILSSALKGDISNADLYQSLKEDIQKQINDLKKKFWGSKESSSETFKAVITPKKGLTDDALEYSLFKYSESGLVYSDSEDIDIVQKAFEVKSCGTKGEIYVKIVPATNETFISQEMKHIIETLKPESSPYGFPYNLPGLAKLELVQVENGKDKGKVIKSIVSPIAQLGITAYLPHQLKGKMAEYDIIHYPATGALNTIAINSTAIDASDVKSIGEMITSISESEKNALENEEAKAKAQYYIKYYQQELKDLEN